MDSNNEDRANGEGAKTSAESAVVDTTRANARRIRQATAQKVKSFDTSSSSNRGTKRKSSETEVLSKAVSQIANLLTNYFNTRPRRATVKEVVDELSQVPDLDSQQTLRGIDLMRDDPVKFETFCELPNEMKQQWLLMHLQ